MKKGSGRGYHAFALLCNFPLVLLCGLIQGLQGRHESLLMHTLCLHYSAMCLVCSLRCFHLLTGFCAVCYGLGGGGGQDINGRCILVLW